MCIIHEQTLHYIFQNIMDAFDRSKFVSPIFMKRIGYFLCSCTTDNLFDSKSLIATQRNLFEWFNESLKDSTRDLATLERLNNFKQIIEELKVNGNVDSGTKIVFMTLLKDLDSLNFSRLHKKLVNGRKGMFYTKLVRIKFDLKLCSAKEFCDLITQIDNCAIKYIQLINRCNIFIRDPDTLTIRHFMGEIDATIEAQNEKYLFRAEQSLKRLADAVHYRLAKQIPSCETDMSSLASLKVLLQSPPKSCDRTPNESWNTIDTSSLSQY